MPHGQACGAQPRKPEAETQAPRSLAMLEEQPTGQVGALQPVSETREHTLSQGLWEGPLVPGPSKIADP